MVKVPTELELGGHCRTAAGLQEAKEWKSMETSKHSKNLQDARDERTLISTRKPSLCQLRLESHAFSSSASASSSARPLPAEPQVQFPWLVAESPLSLWRPTLTAPGGVPEQGIRNKLNKTQTSQIKSKIKLDQTCNILQSWMTIWHPKKEPNPPQVLQSQAPKGGNLKPSICIGPSAPLVLPSATWDKSSCRFQCAKGWPKANKQCPHLPLISQALPPPLGQISSESKAYIQYLMRCEECVNQPPAALELEGKILFHLFMHRPQSVGREASSGKLTLQSGLTSCYHS